MAFRRLDEMGFQEAFLVVRENPGKFFLFWQDIDPNEDERLARGEFAKPSLHGIYMKLDRWELHPCLTEFLPSSPSPPTLGARLELWSLRRASDGIGKELTRMHRVSSPSRREVKRCLKVAPLPRAKVKRGTRMNNAQIKEQLVKRDGLICQGCFRDFDDPLYLELDHIRPRSEAGTNDISNRILLCGPCNKIKSNRLTLSGLRKENKKRGRMKE